MEKKQTSRHSKGELPGKKKDSGTQKPIKKSTSARKVAKDEDDEDADESPRPAKKGASGKTARGGSARQGGGGPPRVDPNAERMKKVFLSITPIMMILLLAAGYALSQREDPKPKKVEIRYDQDIEKARSMYVQAKACYQAGAGVEGAGGLPKLKEAKKLLEDARDTIEKVREAVGDAEQKSGPNANPAETQNYAFEQLNSEIAMLLMNTRKAILERE